MRPSAATALAAGSASRNSAHSIAFVHSTVTLQLLSLDNQTRRQQVQQVYATQVFWILRILTRQQVYSLLLSLKQVHTSASFHAFRSREDVSQASRRKHDLKKKRLCKAGLPVTDSLHLLTSPDSENLQHVIAALWCLHQEGILAKKKHIATRPGSSRDSRAPGPSLDASDRQWSKARWRTDPARLPRFIMFHPSAGIFRTASDIVYLKIAGSAPFVRCTNSVSRLSRLKSSTQVAKSCRGSLMDGIDESERLATSP